MPGRTAWRRRRRPRSRIATVAAALVLLASVLTGCAASDGTKINIYYAPEDTFQRVVDQCNAKANGKYEIVYHKLPRDADGQREQLVRRLAAGDTGLDILGLDVTWVSEFAEAGWAEEWTGSNKAEAEAGVLPGPLESARNAGKLYGAPKNTNVQLLWYDDRLTPTPPSTWDELIQQAQQLKAQGKPHNLLFTGAQFDGLVAVYNSLVASAGGHILTPDARSVAIDAGAVTALETLHRLASSGITDPSLSNQEEDDVRQAFERGNGAFQLNWPFVYSSYAEENPAELEHLKWARYPSMRPGQPSRSTIGGYDLAVSSASPHKPEAFEAALCLRSPESQKFSALKDGVPPSIEAIYADPTPLDPSKPPDAQNNPSMATEYPMKDTILAALKESALRPRTPAYQNLSTVISNLLSPPAELDPQVTAETLRAQLADALESKGVIP